MRARRSGVIAAAVLGVLVVAGVVIGALATGDSEEGGAPATFDGFDGSGALDGRVTPEGLTWTVPVGAFEVDEGTVAADDGVVSIAVLDIDRPLQRVDAEFDDVADAAGIVFRYRDQANYWSIVAAERFGTWNVNKVVQGEVSFMGNTGVGLSPEGTLEVRLSGPTIRVLVNRQERTALVDGDLQTASGAGLISSDDSAGAEWSAFGVLGQE